MWKRLWQLDTRDMYVIRYNVELIFWEAKKAMDKVHIRTLCILKKFTSLAKPVSVDSLDCKHALVESCPSITPDLIVHRYYIIK